MQIGTLLQLWNMVFLSIHICEWLDSGQVYIGIVLYIITEEEKKTINTGSQELKWEDG